jgi:cytochrome P450
MATQVCDVDPALIVDYDHIHGDEVMAWPPGAIDGFREERPIFYSSRYGGFWVVTRYDDIRAIVQDHETFRQHAGGLPANPYNKIHIPLMLDPPEHTKYRKVMAPIFSPRMMAKLEPMIREVIREQIARIAPLGHCDFVDDLCLVPPAAMYCMMLGVDPSRFQEFNQLSQDLIFGAADVMAREGEEAARAFRTRTSTAIDDMLVPILEERRVTRGDDILSILLDAEVDGRALSDEEMLNIASLLFFAGTDSTASIMSYALLFLAQNPRHRQQIVDDPKILPGATQELIRYNAFHQIRRIAARDTELLGAQIREGDIVVVPMQAANHDPRKFPDPLTVDFARSNSGGAITFSAGPHRCIGQHLATLQLRILLEEVHRVITDYRLDPERPYEYMSSHAKTVLRHLPMVYSAA